MEYYVVDLCLEIAVGFIKLMELAIHGRPHLQQSCQLLDTRDRPMITGGPLNILCDISTA